MNHKDKWKAVINCSKDYDGVFYYAVKTTKTFCRPSCKAKAPLRKNILYFDSVDDALKDGFRPCKRCRPDMNNSGFYPDNDLMQKDKETLEYSYNKSFDLDNIAHGLGFSKGHLIRLYKQHYGVTPNEYIKRLRIAKSKLLLKDTNKDILDIACEVGYKSISNFYKCFKEQVNTTPKKYRKYDLDSLIAGK